MADRIIYFDETLTRAAAWSLCKRCRLRGDCRAKTEREELERRLSVKLLTAECAWFVENGDTKGKQKAAAVGSGQPGT
jgi:hypothetical protein